MSITFVKVINEYILHNETMISTKKRKMENSLALGINMGSKSDQSHSGRKRKAIRRAK